MKAVFFFFFPFGNLGRLDVLGPAAAFICEARNFFYTIFVTIWISYAKQRMSQLMI